MIIEQKFTVQAPIQRLWDFLIDIEQMSSCVPGAENVKQIGDNQFEGMLKVKVGPIQPSFAGTAQFLETDAPHRLVAKGEANDQRSNSMASATFTADLRAVSDTSTEVAYQVEVNIRGTLGRFGQGVMREVSKRLTDEFAKCVETRLAVSGPVKETAGPPVITAAKPELPASPSLPPLDVGAAILPDYFPWLLVAGLAGFILGLLYGLGARR